MLNIFIFETIQNIGQLDHTILENEKVGRYSENSINEIFRIMHTIKGSSSMMLFNNISTLAHSIEDLSYFLREQNPQKIESSVFSNLILEAVDFIKVEMEKIKDNEVSDGEPSILITNIYEFLGLLKQMNSMDSVERANEKSSNKRQQYYLVRDKNADYNYDKHFKAIIHFEEGCKWKT